MTGKQGAWKLLLAALFAVQAGAAHALDIDRIEIRSQLGQPLLAEIPIVSATPEELQALQAQLAAPVTFARVGLPRPQGVVADLRFAVIRDARGGPVIRVSSTQPVTQDFLSFLIQLDWGQGRMVREYSLALSAPDTLAAPIPPPILSATMAPSNRIVRVPEPATAPAVPLAMDDARSGLLRAQPEIRPIPLASAPTRPVSAPAPPPAPKPAAPPLGEPTPALAAPVAPKIVKAAAGEYGPVKSGETLSRIAAEVAGDDDTLDQTMLALLRANPDAFGHGNINLLKRGAVLRMPQAAELSQYSAAQAAVLVSEQVLQWREKRFPAVQPPAPVQAPTSTPAPAAVVETPRVAPPRLEISPPAAAGEVFAGVQSGVEGAAAGSELRPQGSSAGAPTAASATTIDQLQAQVAELEALRQQQQTLIAMQNSALAERPASRGLPWLWAVLALAAVFVLGWLLARRRVTPQPSRAHFDPAVLKTDDPAITNPAPAAASATDPDHARPLPHSPGWHAADEEDAGRA